MPSLDRPFEEHRQSPSLAPAQHPSVDASESMGETDRSDDRLPSTSCISRRDAPAPTKACFRVSMHVEPSDPQGSREGAGPGSGDIHPVVYSPLRHSSERRQAFRRQRRSSATHLPPRTLRARAGSSRAFQGSARLDQDRTACAPSRSLDQWAMSARSCSKLSIRRRRHRALTRHQLGDRLSTSSLP
jgi:hypothetical protein